MPSPRAATVQLYLVGFASKGKGAIWVCSRWGIRDKGVRPPVAATSRARLGLDKVQMASKEKSTLIC